MSIAERGLCVVRRARVTTAKGPNALPFGTPGATDVAQALRFVASPLVRAAALPAPASWGGRWQWAQSAQGQDKYAAHHARARGVLGDQEDQGQGQIAHAHAIGGRGGSATPPIALPSRAR